MNADEVRDILFGQGPGRRFTQDTPILPEVWFALAAAPGKRHDLLITPLNTQSANALLRGLLEDLGKAAPKANPVALSGFVALSLTFREVVDILLPRIAWTGAAQDRLPEGEERIALLLGAIEAERSAKAQDGVKMVEGLRARGLPPSIWRVALNRPLELSDEQARSTVKADAAYRLFDVRCAQMTWAVIDSGIDAAHPAFNDGDMSRVIDAYDFTGLRALLNAGYRDAPATNPQLAQSCAAAGLDLARGVDLLSAIHRGLDTDTLDWSSIAPLIRLAPPPVPSDGHGTHVAGIIGANWRDEAGAPIVVGLCPDIRLMDLRILSADVAGTEFAVIAALQFIRYLNGRNQYIAVHGVNLSLSIPHRVENYACGRTPVCDECERLVGTGVTVVAAAGNQGYQGYSTSRGVFEGYATLSITDPGNAEAVITVGSTHKREPHTYGVSYFSSRGPTGDGRAKPDLVAPGERVRSTLPGEDYGARDGTSQAAPHVSAAAALLMARFPELIGQPQRIKRILCDSATDLGRERAFQGHGLLDILRALQSF